MVIIKMHREGALIAGCLLSLLWILAACAGSDEPQLVPEDAPDAEAMTREERIELRRRLQPEKLPAPANATKKTSVTGEVPQSILDSILSDLENLLGAERGQFEVVRSEAVRWNDGSLGCPEPGQMYTQAPMDGYHVVVEYEDNSYDYRATIDGFIKRCPGYQAPKR